MQSISIILSALTLGATAATIRTARSDPHIVDFRTFGATGCSEENQGVYTYVKSDLDKCFQFSETDVVESLFVSDITKGCSGMCLSFFLFAYILQCLPRIDRHVYKQSSYSAG